MGHMFTSIGKLFENVVAQSTSTSSAETERLAAIALMIEVGLSDQSFDQVERDQLVKITSRLWNIDVNEISNLVEMAQEQVDISVSLFDHTRLINDTFEQEQKVQLVKCLWEIAFSDGRIDQYEEYSIRRIADLIYVEHADFIKMKLQVRDHFAHKKSES